MKITAYRICNEDGKHVLSILPCLDDSKAVDIATPDGKVLGCYNNPDVIAAIKLISDNLIAIKTS